jgi:hypothetical protein
MPEATVRSGDLTLEISSPRDTWPGGSPIEVTATLTHDGSGSTTIWGPGSGLIAFGVREIGGTREMGALLTGDCESRQIGPEPFVVEYVKSGGWDPRDDEHADFYEGFFADRQFRLPAGRGRPRPGRASRLRSAAHTPSTSPQAWCSASSKPGPSGWHR